MNKNSESKDTYFSPKTKLSFAGKSLNLDTPKIMGVLNVTPDSFFDGGEYEEVESIQKQAERLLLDGVDIIDIGAYSTRPGAENVAISEEIIRVNKAMKAINEVSSNVLVSIDTFRAEVANVALENGAFMVNDISGGGLDDEMYPLIAKENVPYVMMHMQGNPQTMQSLNKYDNLTQSVFSFFEEKKKVLARLGATQIILDPGFGFAKDLDQNYELLSKMELLTSFGSPVLVGLSRKSMIYKLLEVEPQEALNGTSVLNTIALLKGASILRVHDVKEAREAVTLVSKL